MVETPAVAHGWPFLVARGRRKGYRVLLVPDLLADSNQHGLLAEAFSGGFSSAELPRVEAVAVAGIGPICCAYRTERLGETDPPGSPDHGLLDEHGRPLQILYGLACATDGILDPNAADLDIARAAAFATYRRFLDDEAGFTPERSHSFALRSTLSPGSPGKLGPAAPHQFEESGLGPQPDFVPATLSHQAVEKAPLAPGKALAIAGLAVLGIALAGAVWALLLRSPDGRVVTVQIEEPKIDDVECGRVEVIRVNAVLGDGRWGAGGLPLGGPAGRLEERPNRGELPTAWLAGGPRLATGAHHRRRDTPWGHIAGRGRAEPRHRHGGIRTEMRLVVCL